MRDADGEGDTSSVLSLIRPIREDSPDSPGGRSAKELSRPNKLIDGCLLSDRPLCALLRKTRYDLSAVHSSLDEQVSPSSPSSPARKSELAGARFYYDKQAYTGVHKHGGVAVKDQESVLSQTASLSSHCRPDSRTNTAMKAGRSPKENIRLNASLASANEESFMSQASSLSNFLRPGHRSKTSMRVPRSPQNLLQTSDLSTTLAEADEESMVSKASSLSSHLRTGLKANTALRSDRFAKELSLNDARRPNSAPAGSRNAASPSPKATRQLSGPERFFYDKDTYTGMHKSRGHPMAMRVQPYRSA